MRLKQALSIYEVKQEIEQIKTELQFLEEISQSMDAVDYMSAIEYSGMPKAQSHSPAAPFERESIRRADGILRLKRNMAKKTQELEDLLEEFETFLEGVDDSRDRIIIRSRCTMRMKWETIGENLHMDRTTVSKRFYKYFREKQKFPTIPA